MSSSFRNYSERNLVPSSISVDQIDLQIISDEDLCSLVVKTVKDNEAAQIETSMFEKYLHRVDPKQAGSSYNSPPDTATRGFRKRSRASSNVQDRFVKLSAEQKLEIVARELEEKRAQIERTKDKGDKKINNLKVTMEEADIRLTETKKAEYEFNREIVKGSVNPRVNKIIAEKLIRYTNLM